MLIKCTVTVIAAADEIMSATDQNASASQLVKLGDLIGGIIGGATKALS